MPKPTRTILTDGKYCIVEHALCGDMQSPSETAWSQMEAGEWTEDPNVDSIPDDAQISQTQKMRTGIEWFAEHGYPSNSFCTINDLRSGIWEFRLGRIRISFFDTDGAGGFDPKYRVRDRADSPYPEHDFWWLPEFDEDLRLGHCFGKTTEKTEEDDISETLRVREEDLEHDRD